MYLDSQQQLCDTKCILPIYVKREMREGVCVCVCERERERERERALQLKIVCILIIIITNNGSLPILGRASFSGYEHP